MTDILAAIETGWYDSTGALITEADAHTRALACQVVFRAEIRDEHLWLRRIHPAEFDNRLARLPQIPEWAAGWTRMS